MAEQAAVEVEAKPSGEQAGATVETPTKTESPNWEQEAKSWQEVAGTLGYKDRESLVKDYTGYKEHVTNLYWYLKNNPEAKKQYETFLGGGEVAQPGKTNASPAENKSQDMAALREQLRQEILGDVESRLSPYEQAQNEAQTQREKQEFQIKHPSFTDEKYAELDKKFISQCQSEIKGKIARGMNPQMADYVVREKYRDMSLEHIANLLMPEFLIESASAAKRIPQPLARGMKAIGNNNAATPSAIEQAKKEYSEAAKGQESAEVVKSWAGKLGMTMTEAHDLLKGD